MLHGVAFLAQLPSADAATVDERASSTSDAADHYADALPGETERNDKGTERNQTDCGGETKNKANKLVPGQISLPSFRHRQDTVGAAGQYFFITAHHFRRRKRARVMRHVIF